VTGGLAVAYPLSSVMDLSLGVRGSLGLFDHYNSSGSTLRYDLVGLRLGFARKF